MDISNEERNIFADIQKRLFYMIPEKWDAIYLYASVIEEPFKKPVGEMYFYYFPKGILKRKPVNVYEIPSIFNIDEESYNDVVQKLYSDIKKLREIHREIKDSLWTNLTISIENFQFKVEYGFEDLGENSEFTPYERHIIWRYKNLKIDVNLQTKEEKNIIDRYLDSELILFERENNEIYTESIYQQPVRNIIDYEQTLTVEAAIASRIDDSVDTEKKEKKKNKEEKYIEEDNNSQILFDRVERMKKLNNNQQEDIDEDMILDSDFMKRKGP